MGTFDRLEELPPKFRDRRTARFAAGEHVKQFQSIKDQVERRLDILETALTVNDLMRLPSNHFEALGGAHKGLFSIRINQQWRICFAWPEGQERPSHLEIVDYH